MVQEHRYKMSLVLNNLINKINNKIDAADSDGTPFSITDLQRLSRLNTKVNGEVPLGTIQYRSLGHIPPAEDSAGLGQIVFVKDEQLDSDGRYYYRAANAWSHLITGADSDEDKLIDSDRLRAGSGGGGPSGPWHIDNGRTGETKIYGFGGTPYISGTYYVSATSDGNTTTVSGATLAGGGTGYAASASSSDYAFMTSGYGPVSNPLTTPGNYRHVQYFPYANEDAWSNASITQPVVKYLTGAVNSEVAVYEAGGYPPTNVIEKFPIASVPGGAFADVGDLPSSKQGYHSAQHASSETHGYIAGGAGWPIINYISKWPFATDENGTDVGDLHRAHYANGQANSETYGYSFGGTPPHTNTIEKYAFATDGNATDVGDLTESKAYVSGASSTTHGYRLGGSPNSNVIDKFSFTTDGNATDVGDYGGGTRHGIGTAQI